mgnify:CR=1 FL=1
MATYKDAAKKLAAKVFGERSIEDVVRALTPKTPPTHPLPPRLSRMGSSSVEAILDRRKQLVELGCPAGDIKPYMPVGNPMTLRGNIEGYVGDVCVPVGVVGPLRVNGLNANGDFYVPMATTEGALVASYQRGAIVISKSGGAKSLCLTERVIRAPAFVFSDVIEASTFCMWLISHFEEFKEVVKTTSRHGKLEEMRTTLQGNVVYVMLEYFTGDAAGQNMVTFASRAICEKVLRETPVKPRRWYLESNMSGDKKATASSFMYVRGKKVIAEAIIKRKILKRYINITPEQVQHYANVSLMGGVLTGSIGVQGHFANGLTAVFMATGQDVACVAEAAVGTTQMDITDDGDLYMMVQLPNLIVGSVGGGTRLPTQRAALEMMDCYGTGKARKLAEIIAAVVLAGEISLPGAIIAGEFDSAHQKYGRRG